MAFVLSTFGSWGDVLPLVALGRALRHRGHDACLIAGSMFAETALRAGLVFWPLSPSDPQQNHSEALRLLHDDPTGFVRRYWIDWNRELYERLAAAAGLGPVMAVTVSMGSVVGDLLANMHDGIPILRLVTQPAPPAGMALPFPIVHADIAPDEAVRQLCEALRVPVPLTLSSWRRRGTPVRSLKLWPAWFTHSAGGPNEYVGFLGDGRDKGGIRTQGPTNPPRRAVYVMGSLGTTEAWAASFYTFASELCTVMGCSGLFLGSSSVPPGCCEHPMLGCSEFPPLGAALANADLIVHHGGMGTIAAALGQAVPQLIVPRSWFQAGNAEWAKRLEIAEVLKPEELTAGLAAVRISRLCSGSRLRCELLASLVDNQASIQRLCQVLELEHERK